MRASSRYALAMVLALSCWRCRPASEARTPAVPASASGSPPPRDAEVTHRLDPACGDERDQVGLADTNVTADLVKRDAPLRDQAADEAGRRAELVGGLVDGQQTGHEDSF